MEELHQPVNVAGADKAFNLREVQGEIMIAQPMPNAGPGQCDLVMRLEQFLGVVDAAEQRLAPGLAQTGLEQVQDYLRIARVVLVPRVVHCLARARDGERWD